MLPCWPGGTTHIDETTNKAFCSICCFRWRLFLCVYLACCHVEPRRAAKPSGSGGSRGACGEAVTSSCHSALREQPAGPGQSRSRSGALAGAAIMADGAFLSVCRRLAGIGDFDPYRHPRHGLEMCVSLQAGPAGETPPRIQPGNDRSLKGLRESVQPEEQLCTPVCWTHIEAADTQPGQALRRLSLPRRPGRDGVTSL